MPSLTIVLASTGPAADIMRVGEKLAGQAARTGAEMIVAVPDDMVLQLSALRDLPEVRMIVAPSGSDRGALCAAAMQAATGDVVAFRDASQWRDAVAAGESFESLEHDVTATSPIMVADRAPRRTPLGARAVAPSAAVATA